MMSLNRVLPIALLSLLPVAAFAFDVTSPAFSDGGTLPSSAIHEGFGCHGRDRVPALRWSSPPPETKSLAVTVYDPDAPTGSGWWHWIVFDLPPGTRSLAEGANASSLPDGAKEGLTDYGTPGFGGACPPSGDAPHHYFFTVFALDTPRLDADRSAPAAQAGFQLHAHMIAKAQVTATYGR